MKKTDIAMIILIASMSVLVSYFVMQSIPLFKDANKPVTIQTAEAITTEVSEPDTTVFNDDAINPTVQVEIGQNSDSDDE